LPGGPGVADGALGVHAVAVLVAAHRASSGGGALLVPADTGLFYGPVVAAHDVLLGR